MDLLYFVIGLVLLVLGARFLVQGASRLPLVVGLTVVAFGASSPEMAVSVGAVWGGQYDIAIRNVIGSNIFNVLFILGSTAPIVPFVVNRQIIRQWGVR